MSHYDDDTDERSWVPRKTHISAMLAQTLGVSTIMYLPHLAVVRGALGHMLVFAVVYVTIGIPLLYMENVVGQFTGRDCLEVWHARACLSHLGYVQIFWQVLFTVYLQTINSFVVHYFLISFENPIPFYVCGIWSKSDCDILNYNFTVNQQCMKGTDPLPYCLDLCHTFPEFQYWRFHILGLDMDAFYLPWRVGLASALIVTIVFLSCFKRAISLNWFILFGTVYPIAARVVFLVGSMLQKGVVVKYEDALDADFGIFTQQFSLSSTIAEVLYTLNIGTGLSFSSASKTSFRAPCYSNTVIVVVITCCVTILGVCSTVMMTCPYAFKNDIRPGIIMRYPISNSFEKIPRLLHVYEQTSLWLILCYSYIAISTITLAVCIISGFIEMLSKRYPAIDRSPGLICFIIVAALYIGTAPLLGNLTLYYLIDTKNVMNLLVIFIVLVENIVFVLWYGLQRFSEDVHFMQGIQPNTAVKVGWLFSGAVLLYVFCKEFHSLYNLDNPSTGSSVGWYMLVLNIVPSALVIIVRILIALYKNKLYEEIGLDSSWGPKNDLLKRSRAMFTAQAMTKEYMYRQYHLQAGILKRQKQSNVRCCYKIGFVPKPEGVRFEDEKLDLN